MIEKLVTFLRNQYHVFPVSRSIYIICSNPDKLKEELDCSEFPQYRIEFLPPGKVPESAVPSLSYFIFYGFDVPEKYEGLVKFHNYSLMAHEEIVLHTPIEYSDEFGNHVSGKCSGLTIRILGGENRIAVETEGDMGPSEITVKSFDSAHIGKGLAIKGNEIRAHLNGRGSLEIGDGCSGSLTVDLCCRGKLGIGNDNVFDDANLEVKNPYSSIIIGNGCELSSNVCCISVNECPVTDSGSEKALSGTAGVKIGDHVRIGPDSIILGSVSIGNDSTVEAKSLVSRDFPDNCVIAGNPAEILENASVFNDRKTAGLDRIRGYISGIGGLGSREERVQTLNAILNVCSKDPDLNSGSSGLRKVIGENVESFVLLFTDSFELLHMIEDFPQFFRLQEILVDSGIMKNEKLYLCSSNSNILRYGICVPKDLERSAEWMRKISDSGENWAKLQLFDILSSIGTSDSKSEMVKLATEEAESGNAEFQLRLGRLYYSGNGVPSNKSEAIKWLDSALENGIETAAIDIFEILWYSDSEEDHKKMLDTIFPLAEKGNPDATLRLGRAYREGVGVTKNLSTAAYWMRKSMASGGQTAAWELFDILWRINKPETDREMIDVIVPSAENGFIESKIRLGRAYRYGRGVDRDLVEAAGLMREAASKNVKGASLELFDVLWEIGTPESFEEMIGLSKPEAESGNPEFIFRMGNAYRYGKGVEKNLKKSLECYSKAADLGSSGAKEALGSVKEEIEENNRKKLVLFDVSHYSFLTEAVIIRANRHEDDNSVLMITKKTGKEEFIKKLRASNIFNIVIEYNPFFGINENDEEKIKSSTVQYYDDLLGNLGYRIEDFDVIYSGADLIDSFFVYMDLKKSKPVIIESVPKQLDYESRVTGARRLKMVSDAYANLQEKSGFIDGSNILCSKLKYTTGEKDSDRNTFNMRKEINRVPEAYKTKISNICEINRDLDGSDILLMNSQDHCKYESGIGVEFQPVIYRTLVDYFSETPNITVKVHPESPVDVSQILTNAKAMGDFPIEFIAFTGIHFNNALSIDTSSADKMVEFGLVKKSIRVTKYFYKQFRLMPVLDFILDIDRYLGLNTNTSSFISDDVTRVLASQKTVNCNIPEYVSSCSVEGGNFRIQIGDVPGNEHLISKLKIEKNNDRSMGLFNDFVIEFECPLDISNKIRMFQYERTLENLGLKCTFELEK